MIMDIQIGQSLMPIYIVDKGDAATVDWPAGLYSSSSFASRHV